MNEPDSHTHDEISGQICALQRQIFTLLLALIVVSGTLTVFLYRQATITRHDIDGIKPRATQVISIFKHNSPGVQVFVNQIAAFGQTHPDFRPILQKYGIPITAPKK